MGAGAFLIAERTGISYSRIALLSVVPAVLYFLSVWVMIHYEAKKQGLEPIPADEIPKLLTLLKTGWFYLLPLVTLIGSLMLGYSAYKAAFLFDPCNDSRELLSSRDTIDPTENLGSDGYGC